MRSILITGANSYIGTSFEKYLAQWPQDYRVDTIDMIDGSWRQRSFAGYDAVFHVAGIAHQKETSENAHLYYEINRDLALETAQKAKAEGVRQFVFLSSMSIYGMDTGVITRNTTPRPRTNYGKSKWQAEQRLLEMHDDALGIAVLRPPMVYGKGCRGNFQTLLHFAQKYSFFPLVDNRRSMIYIENLCEYVKQILAHQEFGVFFPQNREYMQTSQMVQWMGEAMGRKIYLSKLLGLGIKCFSPCSHNIQKAFGNLVYQNCEPFVFSYGIKDLKDSVLVSI